MLDKSDLMEHADSNNQNTKEIKGSESVKDKVEMSEECTWAIGDKDDPVIIDD